MPRCAIRRGWLVQRDSLAPGRRAMDGAKARRRPGASTPARNAGGQAASMWASGVPGTRYAKRDEGYIAFQVFGEAPHDLLFIGNWASNVEVMWDTRPWRATWTGSVASRESSA